MKISTCVDSIFVMHLICSRERDRKLNNQLGHKKSLGSDAIDPTGNCQVNRVRPWWRWFKQRVSENKKGRRDLFSFPPSPLNFSIIFTQRTFPSPRGRAAPRQDCTPCRTTASRRQFLRCRSRKHPARHGTAAGRSRCDGNARGPRTNARTSRSAPRGLSADGSRGQSI